MQMSCKVKQERLLEYFVAGVIPFPEFNLGNV